MNCVFFFSRKISQMTSQNFSDLTMKNKLVWFFIILSRKVRNLLVSRVLPVLIDFIGRILLLPLFLGFISYKQRLIDLDLFIRFSRLFSDSLFLLLRRRFLSVKFIDGIRKKTSYLLYSLNKRIVDDLTPSVEYFQVSANRNLYSVSVPFASSKEDFARFQSKCLEAPKETLPIIDNTSKYLLAERNLLEDYLKPYDTQVLLKQIPRDSPDQFQHIFDYLHPYISNFSKSDYKITDLRLFETSFSHSKSNVNNRAHLDGGPKGHFKGILYLTDVSVENGPFCVNHGGNYFKPITGNAGTFILFESQSLLHKSLEMKCGSRVTLMIEFLRVPYNLATQDYVTRPLNALNLFSPF